uniref:Uncharacterized protein n=1 Tax=Cannabis sativa TaxID=3483 RepID=A0A803NHW4_CANSA
MPTKKLKIGRVPEIKFELIKFLRANLDIFAWSHEDTVGINPSVSSHALNIDPNFHLVQQNWRRLDKERAQALKDKLKSCAHIEAFYPVWVSYPVLVPKPNNMWQVCINFANLNKACPKDCFPLPRIDLLVDATAGHEIPSFMDVYSSYN